MRPWKYESESNKKYHLCFATFFCIVKNDTADEDKKVIRLLDVTTRDSCIEKMHTWRIINFRVHCSSMLCSSILGLPVDLGFYSKTVPF